MAGQRLSPLLRFIRAIGPTAAGHAEATDGQLLARFVRQRDEDAFAALLHRHGPMVWSVCRRVLSDSASAEDAFQATFLVLLRKAGSIGQPDLLANYLHGIAFRTAAKARSLGFRRQLREGQPLLDVPASQRDPTLRDLRRVLDEELLRLPDKYRAPLVLCYLEGKTYTEAARLLGWAEGTVSGRLARARQVLRGRLVRRGLALSAGTLALLLPQTAATALPPAVGAATIQAATGIASPPAAALAKGVLHAMFWTQCKITGAVLLSIALLGTGAGISTQRYQAVSAAGPHLLVTSTSEPVAPTAALSARPDDEKKDKKDDKEKDKPPTVDSPDGKVVAVGQDTHVSLLDKASGKEIRRMVGHRDKVTALAFSPDGKRIVSGSADQTTFMWDMATGKTLWKFTGSDKVQSVKFSEDGRTITVQEAGDKKHTLEAATGKAVNRKSG